MIYGAKTPLRIALGGGGTDNLKSLQERPGHSIVATIDRYVHVFAHSIYADGYLLKYSQTEYVQMIDEIQNPLIREALRFYDIPPHTEIISFADIPSGMGLGSSGAFMVSLCGALSQYIGLSQDQWTLADHAAQIELGILGRGGGKLDHYACALGSVQILDFHQDHTVTGVPLHIDSQDRDQLQERLCLYLTTMSRDANAILRTQTIQGLDEIRQIGEAARKCLENGELDEFGRLLNEHWIAKKKRSQAISNPLIDQSYETALHHGALGGKLMGAGSGGAMIFYTHEPQRLTAPLGALGLTEVQFSFDTDGTVITSF